MKKKLLILTLCLTLGMCVLGLTACGEHEHSYTDVVTDPTCTEQGYTTHTCKCGDEFVDTYVDALDHSFWHYESNYDATCTEIGTKTAECSRANCDVKDTIKDQESLADHSFFEGKCAMCGACEGLEYSSTQDDQGYVVSSVDEYDADQIIIPKYHDKTLVLGIGYRAFAFCFTKSIIIPDTVSSIGEMAFLGCEEIKSIIIPKAVTTIGSKAFYMCTKLASITFNGTMEEWNEISKGSGWNDEIPATFVQCSDGKVSF